MPLLVNSFVLPGNKDEDLIGLFSGTKIMICNFRNLKDELKSRLPEEKKLKLVTNNAIAMH